MRSIVELVNAELTLAEQLRAEQRFDELASWLSKRPREKLLLEPQLASLLALALFYTGREVAASDIVETLRYRSSIRTRSRVWFRIENLDGMLRLESGDLDGAESIFRRIEHDANKAGDRLTYAQAVNNRAAISWIRCEFDAALAALGRAQAIYEQIGERTDSVRVRHNIGMVYREVGLYSAAASSFQHAIDAARRAEFYHEVAIIDIERAVLYLRTGDRRLALRTAERGLQIARNLKNVRVEGEGLRVVGTIACAGGDWEGALAALSTGLEIARETQTKLLEAEILEQLAVCYFGLGDERAAADAASASSTIFKAMGADIPAARVQALSRRNTGS